MLFQLILNLTASGVRIFFQKLKDTVSFSQVRLGAHGRIDSAESRVEWDIRGNRGRERTQKRAEDGVRAVVRVLRRLPCTRQPRMDCD